jgi:hypothetical protein
MSIARNLARLTPTTSGQINDTNIGSVATTKLTGQLPYSNQTSGGVIQTLYYEIKSTSTTTSSTYDWLNTTITPKSSNSRFVISADMKSSHTASNSLYYGIGINDNFDLSSAGRSYPSSSGSTYMEGYGQSHSANAQIDQYLCNYVYSQTNGAAFNLKIRSYLQGGTLYSNYAYNYDDQARGRPQSTVIVMEVIS